MTTTTALILSKYREDIASLGWLLRDLLLAKLPGITELPDVSSGIIAFTYGKGYKDIVCAILPSKKGIKLGFYRGSELPDPAGLLTGSGKVHRYVEIKSAQMLENPLLDDLISEAYLAWKLRTAKVEKS